MVYNWGWFLRLGTGGGGLEAREEVREEVPTEREAAPEERDGVWEQTKGVLEGDGGVGMAVPLTRRAARGAGGGGLLRSAPLNLLHASSTFGGTCVSLSPFPP